MSTKKRSNVFLRLTAIFMALFMLCGEPAQAFAAEFNADEGEFAQEVEALDEAQYEDADAFTEDEIVTEEDEFVDYADEEVAEPAEEAAEEVLLEETEDASEEVAADAAEDDFVELETEDEAERILRMLTTHKASSANNLTVTAIPSSEYTITRYADHVAVKNNATASGVENNLYVALVYAESAKQEKLYVSGTEIKPGNSIDLSFVYDNDRNKNPIDDKTNYILWIGRSDSYTDPGTGTVTYYEFKLLGYEPQYDDEGNAIMDGDEQKYVKVDMEEVPVGEVTAQYDGSWKDGYSSIAFKAVIQKNLKSVKLSWKPDTKANPDMKAYKKYELYQLDADYNPTLLKALTGKSYTQKNVNIYSDSLLYLLKCYDGTSTTPLAEYVTKAAPYILEMQSGTNTGDFDLFMTQRPEDSQLYMVELAGQNKENDGVKIINGFQPEWTTYYQVDSNFNALHSLSKGYAVNSTKTVAAIDLSYNLGYPVVSIGTKYYSRVQTVTYINGLKVTSAPSNVVNCKAGPQMCYILDAAGVYYSTADAKSGNYYNRSRASAHINAYLNGDELDAQSPIYVHNTNKKVCAKDGLIYFYLDESAIDNIKSFELLKCSNETGKFKKVKSYSLTNNALMKCQINSEYFNKLAVYAIFYNNFVPEKETYYAVRAVAKGNKTPGGHAYGYSIMPEMDVVQQFSTFNAGANKIQLSWFADDCVKQYWIYRSDSPIDTSAIERIGQNGETRIGKVAISKAKKVSYFIDDDEANIKVIKSLTYVDKTVKADVPYYYYVRPVYDTKAAANDSQMYLNKVSEAVRGKASAIYSHVGNFKAANEATEEIRLSFSQLKNITRYRIFRLEVPNKNTKLTAAMKPDLSVIYEEAYAKDYETYEEFEDEISGKDENTWKEIISKAGGNGYHWEYIKTISTNGKNTGTKSSIDTTVSVGSYYYYLIQPATEKSSSINFSYTGIVRNVPLPVTKASASYDGSSVRLTWEMNSKDSTARHLTVQCSKDGGNNWFDVSKTGYTDTNPRRGEELTYLVRVRYHYDGVTVYSSNVSIKYSLPSGIEVTKASEAGTFSDDVFTIKKGETGKISYRAYMKNGETANYNYINSRTEGSCVDITERDGNSITFTAKETGTMTIYLTCAGIERKVKVVVTDKK